ncbi:MAG: hypothetical protein ACE5OP_10655 [Candidatus Glassbacteria bacterium]
MKESSGWARRNFLSCRLSLLPGKLCQVRCALVGDELGTRNLCEDFRDEVGYLPATVGIGSSLTGAGGLLRQLRKLRSASPSIRQKDLTVRA